jgi:hypothetical protein
VLEKNPNFVILANLNEKNQELLNKKSLKSIILTNKPKLPTGYDSIKIGKAVVERERVELSERIAFDFENDIDEYNKYWDDYYSFITSKAAVYEGSNLPHLYMGDDQLVADEEQLDRIQKSKLVISIGNNLFEDPLASTLKKMVDDGGSLFIWNDYNVDLLMYGNPNITLYEGSFKDMLNILKN